MEVWKYENVRMVTVEFVGLTCIPLWQPRLDTEDQSYIQDRICIYVHTCVHMYVHILQFQVCDIISSHVILHVT